MSDLVSGGGGGAGGGGARSPQSAFPGTKLLCHAQALENGYKRLLAGFGGWGKAPGQRNAPRMTSAPKQTKPATGGVPVPWLAHQRLGSVGVRPRPAAAS